MAAQQVVLPCPDCGSCSTIGRRCASAPASASTPTNSPRRSSAQLGRDATPLTLFSSSWKDRLAAGRRAGRTDASTSAFPVRVLNFAWHRLGLAAGRMVRRRPSTSPTRSIPCSARARAPPGGHDPRPRLPRSPGADPRRNPPRLRRRWPPRTRDGPPRSSPSRSSPPERSRGGSDVRGERMVDLPAGRARTGRRAPAPAPDGPILFMGTLEPRKNVGALLDALRPAAHRRAGRAAPVAGRRHDRRVAPWLREIDAAAAAGHVDAPRLHRRRPRATASTRRRRCWCCPRISKASACRRSKRWRPASRSSSATAARCPRSPATPAQIVEPDDAQGIRRRDAALPGRRRRRRGRCDERGLARAASLFLGRAVPRRSWQRYRRSCMTRDALTHRHRCARAARRADRRRPLSRRTAAAMDGARRTARRGGSCSTRRNRCPSSRPSRPTRTSAKSCAGSGRGTWWEQTHLRRAVARDPPDVFFAGAYTAPLALGVPLAVTIHDVSFAAHPEWFRPREGARRRLLTRAGRARGGSDLHRLAVLARRDPRAARRSPAERIRVIPPGVTRPTRRAPAIARAARAVRRLDLQPPPAAGTDHGVCRGDRDATRRAARDRRAPTAR